MVTRMLQVESVLEFKLEFLVSPMIKLGLGNK